MNTSNLSKWAERCYDDGIEVHLLERALDTTGLYMTKKKIGYGRPCYSWTTPAYHVWINDKIELSTTSYQESNAYYKRRLNELTII